MLRNFTEANSRNLIRIFLFFHVNGHYVIRISTRQDHYVSMREFSNHAVLSMSDSTMAVSSKYTQDLSVQIVFFTFSCKWFLCFYFWAVIWSYIVDLFAALHELASASARTLLKLASSVRALLKPYGDTLTQTIILINKHEEVTRYANWARHATWLKHCPLNWDWIDLKVCHTFPAIDPLHKWHLHLNNNTYTSLASHSWEKSFVLKH